MEEGDTLYSLAEEYGDYFESDKAFINEVKYANHLIGDTIYAGSYLVVPYYSTEYRWFLWIMLSIVVFDNKTVRVRDCMQLIPTPRINIY